MIINKLKTTILDNINIEKEPPKDISQKNKGENIEGNIIEN